MLLRFVRPIASFLMLALVAVLLIACGSRGPESGLRPAKPSPAASNDAGAASARAVNEVESATVEQAQESVETGNAAPTPTLNEAGTPPQNAMPSDLAPDQPVSAYAPAPSSPTVPGSAQQTASLPCREKAKRAAAVARESKSFKRTKSTLSYQLEQRPYLVTGCTPSEIWASIERNRPDDATGRAVGLTSFELDFSYAMEPTTSNCSLKSITLTTRTIVQIPELATPEGLDPKVLTSWQKFTAGIKVHEQGHVDNYLRNARELQASLEALPAAKTCELLKSSIERVSKDNGIKGKNIDSAYDRSTNFGGTQVPLFN